MSREKSDMCLLGLQVPQWNSSYTLHCWSQTNTPILLISDKFVSVKRYRRFLFPYVNIPVYYWPNFYMLQEKSAWILSSSRSTLCSLTIFLLKHKFVFNSPDRSENTAPFSPETLSHTTDTPFLNESTFTQALRIRLFAVFFRAKMVRFVLDVWAHRRPYWESWILPTPETEPHRQTDPCSVKHIWNLDASINLKVDKK